MIFKRSYILPAIVFLICLQLSGATFRIASTLLTEQRADSIVAPGNVSSHVHIIVGGSKFHTSSTPEEIKTSKCTTMKAKEDNSNYWVPKLYYQHPNGTIESVPHKGLLIYYIYNTYDLTPPPPGLRMVAGSAMSRVPGPQDLWSRIHFSCHVPNITADGSVGKDYLKRPSKAFPLRPCTEDLNTLIQFPDCWNGIDLDSSDHKSHMSYTVNGKCPSTHPIRIPAMIYELAYVTKVFDHGWFDENGKPFRPLPFYFSTGDNTGYGLHGDFMNGWDQEALANALKYCTTIESDDCQYFTTQQSAETEGCPLEYEPAAGNEQVNGQMSNIPNLAAIPVNTEFDPCGYSPNAGFDLTFANETVGTCNGAPSGKPAYTSLNGQMNFTLVKAGPLVETPNPVDQYLYLGCYADGTNTDANRTMEKRIGGSNYTPATCRAAVKALGSDYVYFAVQSGGACYASKYNNYAKFGTVAKCSMKCNADPTNWYFCGGRYANQVYAVSEHIDQYLYQGCYNEARTSDADRTMEKLVGYMHTPATCREAVKALGGNYVLYGIQDGGECRATNSSTGYDKYGATDKCTRVCKADPAGWSYCGGSYTTQVYAVSEHIDQYLYQGCYNEGRTSDADRTMEKLVGYMHTPATCREAVKALGGNYQMYGIQDGGECRATTLNTRYNMYNSTNKCTRACKSDPTGWSYCGGSWTTQVYSVYPIDVKGYVGCYKDAATRIMEKSVGGGYTPATCRKAVQALGSGYVMFGLQNGGQCWATTSTTSYASLGVSTACTTACLADTTQWCGSGYVMQVYNVTVVNP